MSTLNTSVLELEGLVRTIKLENEIKTIQSGGCKTISADDKTLHIKNSKEFKNF